MKSYICYVYTPTVQAQHLTTLTCRSEDQIPSRIPLLRRLWPNLTRIEVFDENRRVWAQGASTGGVEPLEAAPEALYG